VFHPLPLPPPSAHDQGAVARKASLLTPLLRGDIDLTSALYVSLPFKPSGYSVLSLYFFLSVSPTNHLDDALSLEPTGTAEKRMKAGRGHVCNINPFHWGDHPNGYLAMSLSGPVRCSPRQDPTLWR
jgi:hypothetical protein